MARVIGAPQGGRRRGAGVDLARMGLAALTRPERRGRRVDQLPGAAGALDGIPRIPGARLVHRQRGGGEAINTMGPGLLDGRRDPKPPSLTVQTARSGTRGPSSVPEVGPIAERVEGRFGPVSVGVAIAHRDRPAQHRHRRLGLVSPLPGGHARSRPSRESRQAGMAASHEERVFIVPELVPTVVRTRTPPGLAGSCQIFHIASHLTDSQVRLAEARAVGWNIGMRLDQGLAHRQGSLACGECLIEPARPTERSAVLIWQFARESLSSGIVEPASMSFSGSLLPACSGRWLRRSFRPARAASRC